jgi:hypothetical protein
MRPFELYYNENESDHVRVPSRKVEMLQTIAGETGGLFVKHHASEGVLEIRCTSLRGLAELVLASAPHIETSEGQFNRALTRAIEDWIGTDLLARFVRPIRASEKEEAW